MPANLQRALSNNLTVPVCGLSLAPKKGAILARKNSEPLDSEFRLFAALAGVACEKRESNYSKLHYSKLNFKIVDLRTGEDLCFSSNSSNLLFKSAFSSFNLNLLPHSMHRRFAVSHYLYSPCHSPCQRNCTLRLQFGLRICQSFSNRRSFSLFRNSFFSLFSFSFFFIVRRVFVFARAALCPVASLTNLQQKTQCLKYGCRQPRLLAWYISALCNI